MVPFTSFRVTLIHSGAFHLDQQPGAPVPRVPQISYDSTRGPGGDDDHIRQHARITNMKRTLLNSLPAFHALMEWYPLRDTVQPFLGPRLTVLFAHAISAETDCLICSTFFRRILIDEPARTRTASTWTSGSGRWWSTAGASRSPPSACRTRCMRRVAAHFDDAQMTALTAFGAIMVATNVFNNALEVELDEYLHPYRRVPAGQRSMPVSSRARSRSSPERRMGRGGRRRSPWRGRARGSARSTSPGPQLSGLRHGLARRPGVARPRLRGAGRRVPHLQRRRAQRRGRHRGGERRRSSGSAGSTSSSTTPASAPTDWPTS